MAALQGRESLAPFWARAFLPALRCYWKDSVQRGLLPRDEGWSYVWAPLKTITIPYWISLATATIGFGVTIGDKFGWLTVQGLPLIVVATLTLPGIPLIAAATLAHLTPKARIALIRCLVANGGAQHYSDAAAVLDDRNTQVANVKSLPESIYLALALEPEPEPLRQELESKADTTTRAPDRAAVDLAYARDVIRYTTHANDSKIAYGRKQLLALVRKYASIWRPQGELGSSAPVHASELKPESWDPDVLALRDRVSSAMWREPRFRRLQYVRQLSTVPLMAALDATHTRLAHSFGTLDAAAAVLSRLVQATREGDLTTGQELRRQVREDDVVRVAYLIAAGIHDVFHGPLGHTLDAVADLLFPGSGEPNKLDKVALDRHLRNARAALQEGDPTAESTPLLEILHACSPQGQEKKVLDAIMAILKVGGWDPGKRETRAKLGVDRCAIALCLRSTLDHPELDIDRVDYLYRDSFHLGRGQVKPPPDEVIESMEVVFEEGRITAAFRREHAAGLAALRDELYRTVYYALPKQGLDAMIQRAFLWTLETELDSAHPREDMALGLLSLTDHELFHLFLELSGKRCHRLPWSLFSRGIHGEAFPCVHEVTVTVSQVEDILAKTAPSAAKDDAAIGVTPFSREWVEKLSTKHNIAEDRVISTVVAQYLRAKEVKYTRAVELTFWKELLTVPESKEQVLEFVRSELGDEEITNEKLLAEIEQRPLVFLVPGWEFQQVEDRRAGEDEAIVVLRAFAPSTIANVKGKLQEELRDDRLLCAAIDRDVPPSPDFDYAPPPTMG